VCLARELTKLHEQSVVLPAAALAGWLREDANRQRGEFVLLIAGAPEDTGAAGAEGERVLRLLLRELPASTAARLAAEITGVRRKELYALASRLSED
ncbi:MAG: rRNA (cytidine-2'-O-)-methyltransferase, partial [Pseudomonadota bacterium]